MHGETSEPASADDLNLADTDHPVWQPTKPDQDDSKVPRRRPRERRSADDA